MKALLFPCLLIFSLRMAGQPGIHFEDMSLPEAIAKSKVEDRNIFFMGFATWCSHCKTMKESIFLVDSVADFFNSHFICVMQDLEKGDGVALGKKYGVTSYPALIFFDTTGRRIYQVAGELKAGDLIREGRNALIPEKQLPYLKEQFELNPADTAKCLAYLQALNRARLETQTVTRTYFTAQQNHPPFTFTNWRILNMGVSDIKSPEFQYIISHRAEFGSVATPIKVDRKIFRTAAYNIEPAANNNDTVAFFRLKRYVDDLHVRALDSLLFTLELTLDELNNRWSRYEALAREHTSTYEWNDYAQLRHIADAFLKHVTDQEGLKAAAGWAKRSAELKEEYGNTLLQAQLLEKTGDAANAKLAAKHAKEIADRTNANTAEADALLQRLGGN